MDASSGPTAGYRNLVTWRRAFALASLCYDLTEPLPPRAQRILADQIRRAATSIPANIAEGYGRRSAGDYARHLRIALGSLAERETHLLLARARGFGDAGQMDRALRDANEVGRLLSGLCRSVTLARERRVAKR